MAVTDEISGIENRTPQEVFDIMSARIEAQAAEIERLREMHSTVEAELTANVAWLEAQAAEIERLRGKLREIASNNWRDQSRARFVAREALAGKAEQ
jgi:hypothetical protein